MISPKTKSLSDVFNSFAADAEIRFPKLKDHLLVIDMNTDNVYGARDTAAWTADEAIAVAHAHPAYTDMKLDEGKHLTSRAAQTIRQGASPQPLNIIYSNDAVGDTLDEISERHVLHVLDHELGHLGLPNGLNCGRLSECVADAYALLRHYQRFGAETDINDKYVSPLSRAGSLIFSGDVSHFTAFVLDEIIARRHAIDFDALTPEETATAAHTFALAFMGNRATMDKLLDAFRPVKDLWKEQPAAAVQTLIDLTLATEDRDIFRTACMWLDLYAAGRVAFTGKRDNMEGKSLIRDPALIDALARRKAVFARKDQPPKCHLTPGQWKSLGL